jgi:hypothetical protein
MQLRNDMCSLWLKKEQVMKKIYSNIPNSGVPLGGLGTGSVELRADGRFHRWEIFNNHPWTHEPPGAPEKDNTILGGYSIRRHTALFTESLIFLLWAKPEKGKIPQMRVLALDNDPLYTNRFYIPFLRTPGRLEFSGEFPKTVIRYLDLDLPLEVTGTFVSPFVPSEPELSAVPGFYADFDVKVLDKQKWQVSITAILTNHTGMDRPELSRLNRVNRSSAGTVIHMSTPGANARAPRTGTMALASPQRNVTYHAGYYWSAFQDGTADRRYAFTDLYNSGKLSNWKYGLQPPEFPELFKVKDLSASRQNAFKRVCREYYDLVQYRKYLKKLGFGPKGLELHDIGDSNRLGAILHRANVNRGSWGGALCVSSGAASSKPAAMSFAVSWHFPNHIVYDKMCGSKKSCPRTGKIWPGPHLNSTRRFTVLQFLDGLRI